MKEKNPIMVVKKKIDIVSSDTSHEQVHPQASYMMTKNRSTFLQYNVPKWACLPIGFTQGLLSILNLLLEMRSLCSAHTTFKTWLNYILAQLLNYYSKSLKMLLWSLLQSHLMSVTSLWLPVLTLIFRKTSSFVPAASFRTTRQRNTR